MWQLFVRGSLGSFRGLLLVGAHHFDEAGELGRCKDDFDIDGGLSVAFEVLLQCLEELFAGNAAIRDKLLNLCLQQALVLIENLRVPSRKETRGKVRSRVRPFALFCIRLLLTLICSRRSLRHSSHRRGGHASQQTA